MITQQHLQQVLRSCNDVVVNCFWVPLLQTEPVKNRPSFTHTYPLLTIVFPFIACLEYFG